MKSMKTNPLYSSFLTCILISFSILNSSKLIANVYVPNTFADPVIITLDNATGKINGGATISLRSAIMAADNLGGTHTITLSTGTYNLTQAIPNREITFGNSVQNITINGNGPSNTIINNTLDGDKDRIFFINPVGTTDNVITNISGIKFQNGYLTSDFFGGAGICAGGGIGNMLRINNCTFDNNVLPVNAYGGAAVCMQVSGDLTVDNCTFTNNVSNDADGGALLFIIFNNNPPGYYGNLTVTNSTFTGNSVSIPGPTTSNGGALAFSGQGGILDSFKIIINNNTFDNNSADGYGGAISANNSPNLDTAQIHFNRFYNNTSGTSALSSGLHFVESSGSVNAENNWWGCNTNPVGSSSTAPCNQAGGDSPGGGSLDANPWLQLKVTASPTIICNTPAGLGNTSAITASFLNNSDGTAIPVANLSRLIGLAVAWTSTLGSLSSQQFTIQANGKATATFTSNGTGGIATVNAQVDNVPSSETTPARANITVNTKPTVTNPTNVTSCVGSTITFTISPTTGTPAPTFQWYLGATPLMNGVQGSGSTISGATTATLTITNVQAGDAAANYNAQAINTCGTTTSANATLTVNSVTGGTVGSDQTICSGGDPVAFTESLASTGSGALTYQWQSSTTDCSSGFSNIGGATATTYDPPSGLSVTTYYRRVTTSTLNATPCTANSNCITVTVNSVTGGVVAADQTICSAGDPVAFTQNTASTGSGALTYQWQSSTANCGSGFSDIGGATGTTYDPPSGLLVTTYYRRVTTSTLNTVACTANSNCITVSVNDVTGGTVGSDQTVCSGGDPAAFTQSLASTGSGALTYQWQSSTTNCSSGFSNIGGATGTTYDPPSGLLVTTYYKRITTSTLNGVQCTAMSNCITVTINNVTGGTVGSDQTICSGGDPVAFTQSLASTGSGTLSYQWQSSTTNCSSGFSDIGGATGTTYDAPSGVLVTTYYRRVTTSTLNMMTCSANSNCITVTVNSVTGGTVGSDQTICSGGDPAAFTQSLASSGSGALTYQWQSSTTNCSSGFSDIGGATGTTYDAPSGLTMTTYYRRVTTSTLSGVQCTANSNCITVTISPNNTITLTSAMGTDAQTVVQFTNITPITYATTGATGANFSGLPPGVSGNWASNVVTIMNAPTSVGMFNYTVTLTGGCGGGTAMGSIKVNPPCTPPSFSPCPGNMTVSTAPMSCAANVSYTATATGTPAPTLTYTFTGATSGSGSGSGSGLSFNKGVTTVTILATNACSPDATCTFTITVNDTELPKITCPANMTSGNGTDTCGKKLNYAAPIGTDNCPGASTMQTAGLASGSVFPIGITTNTFKVTDNVSNTATCSFTITISDTQKPTMTCPPNSTRGTDEGFCKYTINGTEFNATATDNCGITPPLSYSYTGPTSGSGVTTLNSVMFNKGLYTVTWQATDVNSNTNTCSFTVDVKDNELPKITCPADKTVITAPGTCTVSGIALGSPTTSDNCAVATTTNNAPGTYQVGITMVVWKVTDVNGNTATCTQKVTVIPYSCGMPVQVYHTDTTATTAKVKWLAGKCATSYELRIRMEITPGVWGAWSAWVPANGVLQHQFTGLTPIKFYNYQIRTICGTTNSVSINDWFWTLPSFGNNFQSRIANSNEISIPENPMNLVFVPNPARDLSTVIIEGFEQHEKTVTMFDLFGKLVFNVKIESKQNLLELDLQTLGVHPGIYLIRVSDGNRQKTEQLMIER